MIINCTLSTQQKPLTFQPLLSRFDHLNYNNVDQLVKKEMVDGMLCDEDSEPDRKCEACVRGKMKR